MDPIAQTYSWCREQAEALSLEIFLTFFRLGLGLGLSVVGLGLLFHFMARPLSPIQWSFFLMVVVFVARISLEDIVMSPEAKLWTLIVCSLILLFAPNVIPQFLVPSFGGQRRLKRWGYWVTFFILAASAFS